MPFDETEDKDKEAQLAQYLRRHPRLRQRSQVRIRQPHAHCTVGIQ